MLPTDDFDEHSFPPTLLSLLLLFFIVQKRLRVSAVREWIAGAS